MPGRNRVSRRTARGILLEFLRWGSAPLIFTLILLGIPLGSPAQKSCLYVGANYESPHQFQKRNPGILLVAVRNPITYLSCLGNFWNENESAIGAAGAFVAAIFTVTMWISTRALVKGAEATARHQLRAYVLIVGADVFCAAPDGSVMQPPGFIGVGSKAVAQVKLENTGQTPAYDLMIRADIRIVPWPIVPTSLPAAVHAGGTKESVGSGVPRSVWPHTEDPLTQNDIANFYNGATALVVYGWISYTDIFGERQSTDFRWFAGGPLGLRGTSLSAHDEGNDAT
jgi:hypothetical protein